LPFKGRIIYDGLLAGLQCQFWQRVPFGLELHLHSRQTKERIITSLEQTWRKPKPAVPQLKRNWLPQLEEISSIAAKLKGETALQNAAFGLVRASLDIAKSIGNQSGRSGGAIRGRSESPQGVRVFPPCLK